MVNRKRTLRQKPVVYDIDLNISFSEESDSETLYSVNERMQQRKGCKPDLEDAPAFYPTEEEFEDPLTYIAKIKPEAELFGICRIIPPSSWKPPCPLKKREIWDTFEFETRVQRIDKLQNRSPRKTTSDANHNSRKKRKRFRKDKEESFFFEDGPDLTLKSFQNYADEFRKSYFQISSFAKDSQVLHSENEYEPSVEDIEGEYWRIVEQPTKKIEVLYGADLDNKKYGSGFPQTSSKDSSPSAEKYIESGWNLNNLPRLPGSLLSYESTEVSGVLVPWLYVGMCFSSFCWHVEDHHLYSVNYLHWGAPKVWYGVPGKNADKFEATMRKCLPDLFFEHPDLLHKLVTQLSPNILQSEGVPVFRCVQNPGEFVLTFPRAYHSGFNSGLNCAEAVNFATVDWLAHGQNAVKLYQAEKRKTTISHDRLLLGAANEAVKAFWDLDIAKKLTSDNLRWKSFSGKDGLLTRALKDRVEMEHIRRESIPKSCQQLKMEKDFDATKEKECIVCSYDLHMSAAYCRCSPHKFSCLEHVEKLCKCGWDAKTYLFRSSVSDLNTLVEAVEGKFGAYIKWGKQERGWSLSSFLEDKNLKRDVSDENHACSIRTKECHHADYENSFGCKNTSTNDSTKAKPLSTAEPNIIVLTSDDDDEQLASNDLSRTGFHAIHTYVYDKEERSAAGLDENHCMKSMSPSSEKSQSHKKEDKPVMEYATESSLMSFPVSSKDAVLDMCSSGSPAERENDVEVTPLQLGTVLHGEQWCSSQAIFPKGYKSQTTYLSILNPSEMCTYYSEIIDGGHFGPLFVVTVDNFPNEVFVHLTPNKCWELVREEINRQIVKQNEFGVKNLPPLLPREAADGMRLFGLSSPKIMQEIEAMDRNRVCTKYWNANANAFP